MRKAAMRAIGVSTLFSALAFGQNYTISPFAGGGLPSNIPATSVNLGGLAQQTSFSIGNYTGALGRSAVDSNGNVYFIAFNSVLEMTASTGNVSVIAGNGTIGFSGDNGPATSAQLNAPFALAVDNSGNVYISDTGNLRIRRVTAGVITTVAGNGTSGYSGDNGAAILAQFLQPAGLAADTNGNLYIADQGNSRIRKVSGGVITTVAGGGTALGDNGPATSALLNQPLGLAVDSGGNLYIDDRQDNRIRKVTIATNVITTVAGNGTFGFGGDNGPATSAELAYPDDVAMDANGNFYIADTGNLRIRKVSGGTITTIAGTGSPGFASSGSGTTVPFWQPASVSVDGSFNVYISDPPNNRISKLSSGVISVIVGGGSSIGDGNVATGAQLGFPSALFADASGNVLIADPVNQRIRRVSNGVISTAAGGGTSTADGISPGNALLYEPQGVAEDSTGNLYIADTAASKVRKVSNGVITTIAGTGTFGFSGDSGPATSAELGWPVSVAVDSNGNVYIADYYSGRVREVSGGTINTVAGGGISTADGIPATNAELSPAGIAVDSSGNLYIADQLTHKIRKVSSGNIGTVAGNGSVAFSGEGGVPTSAGMGPVGVAVDTAGNIYIADFYNNRVRKVSNGLITTIAGNGTLGFGGDGGAATSAQIAQPESVSVDPSGNVYVADTANNRVRILSSTTASCTYSASPTSLQPAAAGGSFPISLQTQAGCAWSVSGLPSWITVSGASSGTGPSTITLVVAANMGPAQNATLSIANVSISVSQAAAQTCTYTLAPSSLQPTAAGGSFPINLQTQAGCAWSVSGLPSWITVSGASSGTGSATVTLVVAADNGAPQSVVVSIGSASLVVNQANSSGTICTYALSAGGQAFSATGGVGSFTVTTTAGCAWAAYSTAGWITTTSSGTGNGTVNFQAAANSSAARAGAIDVLGLSFDVEESAASIVGYTSAGSMPDIAIAGDWSTTITLVNPSTSATQLRLSFFDLNGNPLMLPLTFLQSPSAAGPLMASSIDRTLAPGTVLEIASTGPASQTTLVGWAQLLSSGSVNGFATYRFTVGNQDHQALIPLENRNGTDFLVAYDNTNGFVDGIAITNTAAQSASVGIIIRNDAGTILYSSTLGLQAMGATQFVLPTNYAFTANGRGTVELDAPAAGQISILGIEYNTATGGFSTIPALVKQ